MGQEIEHHTQPLLICLPFCLLPSSLLLLLPSSSLSLLLPLHLLLPLLFFSPPPSSRSLDLRKLTPMQLTRDTLHSVTGGETASTALGINHHALTFSFSPTSHPSHSTPLPPPPLPGTCCCPERSTHGDCLWLLQNRYKLSLVSPSACTPLHISSHLSPHPHPTHPHPLTRSGTPPSPPLLLSPSNGRSVCSHRV